MKILYLIDRHLNCGGAPISTTIIANEMVNFFDVYMIFPNGELNHSCLDNRIVTSSTPFFESNPSPFSQPIKFIRYCCYLEEKIKNIEPNIIHVEMPISGWAIGLLIKKNKIDSAIKIIYHDRAFASYSSLPVLLLTKYLIKKNYKNIVCLTNNSTNFWQSNNNNVFVIPNVPGKEFDNFISSNYKSELIKQLIFIGRLTKEKNWPLSFKIIDKLLYLGKKVKINIVISYFDEKSLKKIKKIKKKYNGFDNVNVLINQTKDEVSSLFYKSDILVMTSSKESFGRTAVEAMSRKCVVIGTNAGGLPDVISLKNNILKSNSDDFVKRILSYLDDENQLISDQNYFYERYCKNYSLNSHIKSHLSLYDKIK